MQGGQMQGAQMMSGQMQPMQGPPMNGPPPSNTVITVHNVQGPTQNPNNGAVPMHQNQNIHIMSMSGPQGGGGQMPNNSHTHNIGVPLSSSQASMQSMSNAIRGMSAPPPQGGSLSMSGSQVQMMPMSSCSSQSSVHGMHAPPPQGGSLSMSSSQVQMMPGNVPMSSCSSQSSIHGMSAPPMVPAKAPCTPVCVYVYMHVHM
jgi:hypothetical protein